MVRYRQLFEKHNKIDKEEQAVNILYLEGNVYQIEVCNLHYSVIMLALCFYAKINHCAQNYAGIFSIILTVS